MGVQLAVEERRRKRRRRRGDGGRRIGRGAVLLTAGKASALSRMVIRAAEMGMTVEAVLLHVRRTHPQT